MKENQSLIFSPVEGRPEPPFGVPVVVAGKARVEVAIPEAGLVDELLDGVGENLHRRLYGGPQAVH